MLELLLSQHLRVAFIFTLLAGVALLALSLLWCCARTCCLVPRRMRQCIGVVWCAALFVTAALAAYTLTEAHAIRENRELAMFGFV